MAGMSGQAHAWRMGSWGAPGKLDVPPVSAAPVVGRDMELATIARWADGLSLGPSALVIGGEAGIGKTTLWREAVRAGRGAGCPVISCRPTQAESKLPYAGLGDLFDAVPDDVLGCLPRPQRIALDVALLRVEPDTAPLQRRAVAAAVLSTLLTWGRATPLVVAIDDLQWLDVPSLRALQFAARRITDVPVGFAVATRTNGAGPDLLDLRGSFDRVTGLTVTPFDGQSLDLLLRAHLQSAFLPQVLRRIEQTSGGNPFFALELGRALLDPQTSSSAAEPLTVSPTLADLLGVRLARLSTLVRQALVAAAALAHPTVEAVVEVAGYGGAKRLDRAVEAGVITVDDGLVRFTHPLLASVVYSQASASERRHLHLRLAALVSDPDERARHLALGVERPDALVAAAIDAAGSRAGRRGAPETAAVLLEEAARLTPATDVDDVVRRRLDAADHHIAAGETARARVLLGGALAMPEGRATRARALHRLGTIGLHDGDFLAAEALLREAATELGDDLPLRAAIERDIAYALLQSGRPEPAVHHTEAELRAAEASADPVLIAEALDHLCMVRFLSGQGLDPALLARAVALDDQVGAAPPLAHPGPGNGRFPLAATLKWTDRFDAARELLRSLHEEHAEQGDEGALAVVLFHLGELECWAGNWATAARLAEQSRQLGERTAQAGILRRAGTLQAMVGAYCGDVDAARSAGLVSLEQCEQVNDTLGVIRSLKSLGLLELSMENVERARDCLAAGVDLEAAAGYDPSVLRLVPDAVEAFVGMGQLGEATKLVDALAALSPAAVTPWVRATSARCRGIVHAAGGDLASGRDAIEASLREHEQLPQPFERARTLLVAGTIERRAKQKRAAREALEEAKAVFDALGADRWSARASAEMGRIGGRPPRSQDLTASEHRVAELVAGGQTNREIAAAMFLSEKTVEAHLTHIYRKLGVDSRRQLARWVVTQDR